MLLRLRALAEDFRNSLFWLPLLFVVGAVVLWRVLLSVDRSIDQAALPEVFRFADQSAAAVLSAIAGATITVAGIVFSVTAVVVQLASSQFSPRVLRTFRRDRFQQVVLGTVMSTFVYALLTLSSLEPVTPHVTLTVGLALAVVAVVAILASVDHTVQTIRVGEVVHRIAEETMETAARFLPELGQATEPPPPGPAGPPDVVVRGVRSGWVQQFDPATVLDALPPGATARITFRAGAFVPAGTPLLEAWGPADQRRLDEGVLRAIDFGTQRTMQEDVDFGIRQLVDVGLRALSPAVNDPTTAYEVVQHLGGVLRAILVRDLPPPFYADDRGRVLFRPHELRLEDYVSRSFDQLRNAAREHPALHIAMLRTLALLQREVVHAGLPERVAMLRHEATLVLAEAERSSVLPADLERVRAASLPCGVSPRAADWPGSKTPVTRGA